MGPTIWLKFGLIIRQKFDQSPAVVWIDLGAEKRFPIVLEKVVRPRFDLCRGRPLDSASEALRVDVSVVCGTRGCQGRFGDKLDSLESVRAEELERDSMARHEVSGLLVGGLRGLICELVI